MKTIEEKMLEANKARTDILADNPEINSKWTPNAIGIMAAKNGPHPIDFTQDTEYQMMVKNGMIDFTQDSEYKRLYESKPD